MAEKKENWFAKKIAATKKRAQKDKKYKKRVIAAWAIALTIWTGAMFFLAQVAVSLVALFFIKQFNLVINENVAQTVIMAISYVVAIVLIILPPWYFMKSKVGKDGLGLRGLPTWTDILLAPIGYIASMVATMAVLLVIQAFVPSFNLQETQDVGFRMESLYSNADKMVAFAALVILAPIAEELIFRGYLYGKLRTRLSAIPAIILVSVLFGFMHGQWNVGVVVGVMSIFLCIARELTGTIYAGILMHMIRNGLAFYLLYINPISAVGVLGVALPIFLL
jgi:membrane protease YdiL (CAAX protease family)